MENKKTGTLMLIITNKCNLSCSYCYENNRPNKVIQLDIAKTNITEILNSDTFSSINISLFGGEPFLYFELVKEICEWTWEQKWKIPYIFNFSTNGTLLKDNMKKWIIKNRKKLYVSLSVDGGRESQNMNRNNSFDLIDLDFFSAIKASIKMTISKKSLPNLCKDVKFIHSYDFEFSDCNLAMGIDWSESENLFFLKRELEKLLEFYKQNLHLNPAQIINMDIGGCENKKVMHKWCGVGRELMTIDVDGKKYPCNFITPMTFNDDELDILLKTDFTDVREILDKDCFDNCYIYPVCPTCYAADYSITHSINTKDKSICELMKIRSYYSASLEAFRISKKNMEGLSIEEQGIINKKIKAILQINKLYRGLVVPYEAS